MDDRPPPDASATGAQARHPMRPVPRGALGTVEVAGGGPYASLVMLAADHDASPPLLSDLADRTRNLEADPRASLLLDGTLDRAMPPAGERATLQGRLGRVAEADRGRALAATEAEVVGRMNADHADAARLYAERLLRRGGAGRRLTGVDPEGAGPRRGREVARLPFDRPARDAEAARVELARLVERARGAEAAGIG